MNYIPVENMQPFFTLLPPNSNLYEFGVCTGNSITQFLQYGPQLAKVFGFDSFEGLPNEAEGVWRSPDWNPGVFNVVKEFNLSTKEEAKQRLMEKFVPYENKVTFIDGWYKDTLTNELAHELYKYKCHFLHIDTDLYISAYEALDWMFNNYLVAPNCIVRYDDWFSTPEWVAGESRAHKEICEKYHLDMNRIQNTNVFIYKGEKL
jgi:hypothetical protein